MKRKLFYAAIAAVAMTSCNNEEIVELNPGDAVEFGVVSGRMSRGETTTSNIADFKVWSRLTTPSGNDVDSFFDAVVRKEGGNWSYGDTYYWGGMPANFYSVSPADLGYGEKDEDGSIYGNYVDIPTTTTDATDATAHKIHYCINHEVGTEWADTDLLYAVNKKVSKNDNDGKVNVNFRHALSQIAFKVKNTNENLKVEVNSIEIVRTKNYGVFTMPNATTAADNSVKGYWSNLEMVSTDGDGLPDSYYGFYKGDESVVTLEGVCDAVDFTGRCGYLSERSSMFLMPQTLEPSKVTVDAKTGKAKMDKSTGNYIAIKCRIFQKGTGSSYFGANPIWGEVKASVGDSYEVLCQPVYVPACGPEGMTWEAGKKYVYTIAFGEGGGYDEEGDKVLVPVSFDVAVDDFEDANFNVDMKDGQTKKQ